MAKTEEQTRRVERLQRGMKRATAAILVAAAVAEMVGVAFIKLDKGGKR